LCFHDMNKKIFSICVVSLVFAFLVRPSQAVAGQDVRVLVLQGAKAITIEGASGRRGEGALTLKRLAGTEKVLENNMVKALPLTFSPARGGEFIYINKRPYRGRLRLYADDKDGLLVVDELDIEEYLAGIINYEISSAWPQDAVMAQAVAARTYVLYRMERAPSWPYDIEGTTAGQVYKGAASEDEAATRAVNRCRGEVLVYDGKFALTVYHSNGGGRTDAAEDIWSGGGEYYPYLRSVQSPYDAASPRYRWDFAIPAYIFGKILRGEGHNIGTPGSLKLEDITPGGRVKSIRLRDGHGRTLTLGGEELRRLFGYSILRSSVFTVSHERGLFIFSGRGSGHGVGMSQWGARGMAEAGYSYKEILRHYYPGARLKKLL